MWVVYALFSAFFAGIMSFLAKVGVADTDSDLATALRTVIIAICAWLMVFVVGSQHTLININAKSLMFLTLSGLSTGVSWLCYFRALQLGDINKVVPIDKSSTVLTMLLSSIFLREGLTPVKICAMIAIGTGTYLMIERKETIIKKQSGQSWLIYAILSAIFASLSAILSKLGVTDIESNLATALRTSIVLIMAWAIVFSQGKHRFIPSIDKRSRWFIGLSGIATGLSWLCFYRALQLGDASIVVPIDKLSIAVTIALGAIFLKERLTKRSITGLLLIVTGTLSLLTG